MKNLQVILKDCGRITPIGKEYKVLQLVNTVEFRVGQYIDISTATLLCERENHTIIVKGEK